MQIRQNRPLMRYRHIETAQARIALQQPRKVSDVRQRKQLVANVGEPLPGKFFQKVLLRKGVPKRITNKAQQIHTCLLTL
jgi:hypothetical protein